MESNTIENRDTTRRPSLTSRMEWLLKRINKSGVSLIISAVIISVGVIILLTGRKIESAGTTGRYFLSCGIFAFAGGFTNWLAVLMLFNSIPLIYGSGVIPKRYIRIRMTVKEVILHTFFEENYISKYLLDKINSLNDATAIKEKVKVLLESDQVDELIREKISNLAKQPVGQTLTTMGFDVKSLLPIVKPFVVGFGTDLTDHLSRNFSQSLNIARLQSVIRGEIDSYLDVRARQLTANLVTRILKDVIQRHLGWIVVWGCTFGGLFGIFFQVVGLAPQY